MEIKTNCDVCQNRHYCKEARIVGYEVLEDGKTHYALKLGADCLIDLSAQQLIDREWE